MQARLTTGTAFGLHLTIWTLLLLMGVWLFAPIVEAVLTTEPIVVVDQVVAHWLHTHTTSWLTSGMRAISTLAALPAGLTMTKSNHRTLVHTDCGGPTMAGSVVEPECVNLVWTDLVCSP